MSKRVIMSAAAGVVAGAVLVGVPTFAYAGADSTPSTSGSDMTSVMNDPAFLDRMKTTMSDLMSDPKLREQMRSTMGDMPGSGMGNMDGGNMDGGNGGSAEGNDPGQP